MSLFTDSCCHSVGTLPLGNPIVIASSLTIVEGYDKLYDHPNCLGLYRNKWTECFFRCELVLAMLFNVIADNQWFSKSESQGCTFMDGG